MHLRRHLVPLLFGATAIGCSMLGLDELAIPECSETPGMHSQCAVLDERDHIPEHACFHWQCRRDNQPGCALGARDSDGDGYPDPDVCAQAVPKGSLDCDDSNASRHPRHSEECDGLDNDCDNNIDEELAPLEHPRDASWIGSGGLAGDHPITLASVAEWQSDRTPGSLAELTSQGHAWLIDGEKVTVTELRYDSATTDSSHRKSCPTPAGNVACNFAQLSSSVGRDYRLVAAVSDNAGCTQGTLRIGVAGLDDDPSRVFLGGARKDTPNNLQYGIEEDGTATCSTHGVRAPTIASARLRAGEQGVVLWLERSVDDGTDACSDGANTTEIRGMGIYVDPGTQPVARAIGVGRSAFIGEMRGGNAAALISIPRGDDNAAYVAAFGAAQGGLEIVEITALGPANNDTSDAQLSIVSDQRYDTEATVDHVASAIEPGSSTSVVRVAAAYRSGCDDVTHVQFSLFEFPLESAGPRDLYSLSLSAGLPGERLTAGPALAYRHAGFISGDGGDEHGGWVVAWRDRNDSRLVRARVTDDGRLLDVVTRETTPGLAGAFALFTGADDRLSYLGVTQDTRMPIEADVLCKTPKP